MSVNKKMRGQLSIEFIIFISFAMIMMVSFLVIIYEREQNLRAARQIQELREIALRVQSEIDTASVVEDGYLRRFTLPDNIYGLDYQIFIVDNYVLATSEKYSELLSIIPCKGEVTKGVNTIRKENGTICLNSECP